MLILRHTLLSAALGAAVAYALGLGIFAIVGQIHGFDLSLWPTGFMFVMIALGILVGGAAGVETGVIEADNRARARRAAMRRHPASSSRAATYHASNQWGR